MSRSQALTGRSSARFVAAVPGSKSYTNRALVLAAMRPGTTDVIGGLTCDDTSRLADALSAFHGLEVTTTAGGFRVTREPRRLGASTQPLDLGAAGTPARFLLGFAAATDGATVITGGTRLRTRPMGDLLDCLRGLGVGVECLGSAGFLPTRIRGGPIASRRWTVRGDLSSQFISSLLLLASQQPDGPVRLEVPGPVVSRPYVDMTVALLRALGIGASWDGDSVLVVEPGPAQTNVITVEPDASSMSYFLAAAALTGTQVAVEGLGTASVQGDVGFAHILEHMGCALHMTDRSIRLTGGPLTGLDIDCGAMPDIVPTLAVVAARARGTSRIRGIAHLRTKESDRIHALTVGLQRLGVTAEEGSDSLTIHPGPLSSGTLPTFEDHRIAMAFAVLGLVVDGLGIDDPDCVTKSFPDFWRELARFRAHHEGSVST